jgi:ribosomal protein S25
LKEELEEKLEAQREKNEKKRRQEEKARKREALRKLQQECENRGYPKAFSLHDPNGADQYNKAENLIRLYKDREAKLADRIALARSKAIEKIAFKIIAYGIAGSILIWIWSYGMLARIAGVVVVCIGLFYVIEAINESSEESDREDRFFYKSLNDGLAHKGSKDIDSELREAKLIAWEDENEVEYEDERYDDALALVADTQQASISMIQRQLRIGYNRAEKIIEKMEQEGVIGPSEGTSKSRTVYINKL